MVCKTGDLIFRESVWKAENGGSDVRLSHHEPDPAGRSSLFPPLRDKWADKEERLRRTVTQVLKCDVNKEQPLEPAVLPLADCVLSSLCLEAACLTQEAFRAALRHIRTLLRPKGHLVLGGGFDTTFYMVGAKKFPCLPLKEKFVCEALQKSGFTIQKLETAPRAAETMSDEQSDYTAMFVVVAQRND